MSKALKEKIEQQKEKKRNSQSEEIVGSLSAYYMLAEQALFNLHCLLSRQEAQAIADCFCGVEIDRSEDARGWADLRLLAQLKEGLDFKGCAAKYKIDREQLLKKVETLSFFERWVLSDWAATFSGCSCEEDLAKFAG